MARFPSINPYPFPFRNSIQFNPEESIPIPIPIPIPKSRLRKRNGRLIRKRRRRRKKGRIIEGLVGRIRMFLVSVKPARLNCFFCRLLVFFQLFRCLHLSIVGFSSTSGKESSFYTNCTRITMEAFSEMTWKTIQTIAFLAAVFGKDTDSGDPGTLKRKQQGPVLIIGPASVLQNWENEFSIWATFRVSIYHGPNRDLILDKVEGRELEVMITSFDTFRIYGTTISEVTWDIVIVDEAHRLKNEKAKLYIACLGLKTKNRYGLTGTVMQNKIMELFNLFDWVAPGSLGSREHFREFYDEPLKLGQRSSAPEPFIQVAETRKKHLRELLSRYLLRRTKEETVGNLMLGKEDNIVFCEMSEPQKRAYQRMLRQPEIRCLINKDLPCSCGSPLSQGECHNRTVPDGVIWRYLHRDSPDGCDWCPGCLILPCILKLQQIRNHVELIKPNLKDDEDKQKKDAELAENVFGSDIDLVGGKTQNESFMGLSDVKRCGKMKTLERLMTSWVSHGDKVLPKSIKSSKIASKYNFWTKMSLTFFLCHIISPRHLAKRIFILKLNLGAIFELLIDIDNYF